MAFAAESVGSGPGAHARCFAAAQALPFSSVARRLFAGFGRDAAPFGGRQSDTGTTSFGKADRNGLLRGTSAVLTFANVMHFFANELSRLRAGGLPFFLIAFRSLDGLLVRHSRTSRVTSNPRM